MAGLTANTLTEDTGVDLPDTAAWTPVRTTDASRQRVCIFVFGVVVPVFSLASGVAPCPFIASYACSAFRTLDSVTASGRAFPYFSRVARYASLTDKLGGVAAAVSGMWVRAAVRVPADEGDQH